MARKFGSRRLLNGSGKAAAAIALTATLIAGCNTSPGSTAAAGGGGGPTIDVGDGYTVELPTEPLRVGVFMNFMTDAWTQNFASAVQEKLRSAGLEVSVMDARADITTQINQLQNAATGRSFDAAIVVPVDGQAICRMMTETLPSSGILVVDAALPICDRGFNSGEELWAPGTFTYVGGDSTVPYLTAWANAGGEFNPGPQKVLAVVGPQIHPNTQVEQEALERYAAANPEFEIADFLYTDFTTPSGYNATLNYLKSNRDISLIMSGYSPDLSRGVIQALTAEGLVGQIKVADVGASAYSYEQMQAGNIQFTLPFYPITTAEKSAQAILDAAAGIEVPRVVSNLADNMGTPEEPVFVNRDNVDSFTPEY